MVFKVLFLVSIVLFYVNCSTLPPCPENQEWNNCQSACPKTCATKDARPKPCILSCKGGCGCQSGYVFETEKFEKCIKVDDCVKTDTGGVKCHRNEVYSECNAHCQKSCEGEPGKCTKECVPGCICRNGFIRSKRVGGRCIADDTCPM